jgi:phosphoserine phosphatase
MSLVLSLIAAEAKAPLGAKDIDDARRVLEAAGAAPGAPAWLAARIACDIPFAGDAAAGRDAVRQALSGRSIDVNVVPTENRRKRLLLADMDSTMIEQECIDELAAELGLRDRVAAITERAMRGEIEFAPALRERVALLRGLPIAVVDKVLQARISIMPGARTLVATMHRAGAHTTLVSGGFTAFVEPVARRIGFDETRANVLIAEGATFSGRVAEPILGADAKEAALTELTARLRLAAAATLAVGDGANDAGMVRRAGLGVAYRAKPALRAVAAATIDHSDLTGLLYLQGFSREEFVEAEGHKRHEQAE